MRIEVHDPHEHLQTASTTPACVVFSGGAWRTIFFLGVVESLQRRFSEAELRTWAFCGLSAGAVYALALAIHMPHAELKETLVACANASRSSCCGVLGKGHNGPLGVLITKLLYFLPEKDLVRRLHGRFAITFTHIVCGRPVAFQASDFATRDELWDVMWGSGNVPGITDLGCLVGKCLRVRGRLAFDGGFSAYGSYPLLPCRTLVYVRCCGTEDDNSLLVSTAAVPVHLIRPSCVQSVWSWNTVRTPAHSHAIDCAAAEAFGKAEALFASWPTQHGTPSD